MKCLQTMVTHVSSRSCRLFTWSTL